MIDINKKEISEVFNKLFNVVNLETLTGSKHTSLAVIVDQSKNTKSNIKILPLIKHISFNRSSVASLINVKYNWNWLDIIQFHLIMSYRSIRKIVFDSISVLENRNKQIDTVDHSDIFELCADHQFNNSLSKDFLLSKDIKYTDMNSPQLWFSNLITVEDASIMQIEGTEDKYLCLYIFIDINYHSIQLEEVSVRDISIIEMIKNSITQQILGENLLSGVNTIIPYVDSDFIINKSDFSNYAKEFFKVKNIAKEMEEKKNEKK